MASPPPTIVTLDPAAFGRCLDRLAEILQASCAKARASASCCRSRSTRRAPTGATGSRPAHAAGGKVVLAAVLGDEVVGTAQLDFDAMPSKRHHAEVSKVLVDPRFRRAGVARALMAEIERRATEDGRWLLTLDTAGDAAETLYRSLGYTLAGTIPLYARDAFEADRYDATRLMYKDLRGG